uniref:Uncharacterized protein n=1 Tax=Phaeomonas parva TaxID=124430 RepID=A0A7S1UHW6_9STRA
MPAKEMDERKGGDLKAESEGTPAPSPGATDAEAQSKDAAPAAQGGGAKFVQDEYVPTTNADPSVEFAGVVEGKVGAVQEVYGTCLYDAAYWREWKKSVAAFKKKRKPAKKPKRRLADPSMTRPRDIENNTWGQPKKYQQRQRKPDVDVRRLMDMKAGRRLKLPVSMEMEQNLDAASDSGKAAGFGTAGRVGIKAADGGPGPAYDVSKSDGIAYRRARGGQFGVGLRSSLGTDGTNAPGPGAYEVKGGPLSKSAPGFGVSTRADVFGKESAVPGPGAYDVDKAPRLLRGGQTVMGPVRKRDLPKEQQLRIREMKGFGFGCSVAQHIKFGGCLDMNCSRRAGWETSNGTRILALRDEAAGFGGGNNKLEDDKTAQTTPSYASATTATSTSTNSFETVDMRRIRNIEVHFVPDVPRKKVLHLACLHGEAALVDDLCVRGADVDEVDEEGMSPLMIAAHEGHAHIVRRLLFNADFPQVSRVGFVSQRATPEINLQDKHGRTALMHASLESKKRCVELLLEHGADSRIRDERGLTAVDIAGSQALYQVLRQQELLFDLREKVSFTRTSAESKADTLDAMRVKLESRQFIRSRSAYRPGGGRAGAAIADGAADAAVASPSPPLATTPTGA